MIRLPFVYQEQSQGELDCVAYEFFTNFSLYFKLRPIPLFLKYMHEETQNSPLFVGIFAIKHNV